MGIPLSVLIVEDSEEDTFLLVKELKRGGYEPAFERVETADEMSRALNDGMWDIIISDYKMPCFDGLSALRLYKARGLDIPFIIVSGTIGEETAVETMKAGAHDYVMKNRISRLVPAIKRELREAGVRKEHKEASKRERESEARYRTIFENAVEGMFQSTPEGRFISVNPAMARIHGFASPEEMVASIINVGEQLYVNPEERKRYLAFCEEGAVIEDFEAQIARKDGTTIWTSTNARTVKDEDGDFLCFEGTVEDITSRKRAEKELQKTMEKLRKSLIGTIQAMSLMVEMRDPYTSGHQKRVSGLARAMAQEMGLSKEAINNIRIAGRIHDIGKMSVPAEILTKPTRLSDLEMSLIKVHPQSGYNILKETGLPPIVAGMVLQHHERIDGSGYPQGLRDGEMYFEAKILAVADVVEAMASHRPYRPALGINAALDEIEKNKGARYDAEITDICVKLFREKGLTFI